MMRLSHLLAHRLTGLLCRVLRSAFCVPPNPFPLNARAPLGSLVALNPHLLKKNSKFSLLTPNS